MVVELETKGLLPVLEGMTGTATPDRVNQHVSDPIGTKMLPIMLPTPVSARLKIREHIPELPHLKQHTHGGKKIGI